MTRVCFAVTRSIRLGVTLAVTLFFFVFSIGYAQTSSPHGADTTFVASARILESAIIRADGQLSHGKLDVEAPKHYQFQVMRIKRTIQHPRRSDIKAERLDVIAEFE